MEEELNYFLTVQELFVVVEQADFEHRLPSRSFIGCQERWSTHKIFDFVLGYIPNKEVGLWTWWWNGHHKYGATRFLVSILHIVTKTLVVFI